MTTKATIQDVVDAIDRQTELLRKAIDQPAIVAALRAAHDAAQPRRNRPRSDGQPSKASEHPQPATDAPEPAQTLADLEPCLGDRVRAKWGGNPDNVALVTYRHKSEDEDSQEEGAHWRDESGWATRPDGVVLTHLDPVTPEEPPVGSGMLVDANGSLWRREDEGWRYLESTGKWSPLCLWRFMVNPGGGFDGYRLRPATTTDLYRHGVGEDGEPVGKGAWADLTGPEQQAVRDSVAKATVLREAADALGGLGDTAPPPRDVQIADWLREYADAIEKAGER